MPEWYWDRLAGIYLDERRFDLACPGSGGSGRPGRGKRQVVAPTAQIDAGHPVPMPFGQGDS